jgi:zinc protease
MAGRLQTSDFRLQTWPGLSPDRTVLENGAVLLTKATSATPSVAINLAMRAGSASDPAGRPGTAWLLSRVIDRGTETRSALDIAEDLDGRGIALSLTVTRHLFSIVCTCLADDFEPVFRLLADILINPSLPESEIAIRKGEVITAIRQDEDSPAICASEALMALLYPDGHPYGRRTKGTIVIVDALTRGDLRQFHVDRFTPSSLTAVVVGDVEPSRVRDAAGAVFEPWRRPAAAPLHVPAAAAASRRQRLVIPMMNKAQADIAYGFVAIARNDPDYYAWWLMNNVFGQYAMGGRLGESIRERQGMAYYASSSLDANIAPGPLVVRAGVAATNVDRAIASIDAEVRRLIDEGVSPKELEESRRYLIGSIPRALETNAAIANFLQTEELFGLGLDYDARLPDLLGAVTLDDVNAAARKTMHPDRAGIVVAGPYSDSP